jgi:hypothetical protein
VLLRLAESRHLRSPRDWGVDSFIFGEGLGLGGDVELQAGEGMVLVVGVVNNLPCLFDGADDKVNFFFETLALADFYLHQLALQYFFCFFGVFPQPFLQLSELEATLHVLYQLGLHTFQLCYPHFQPLVLELDGQQLLGGGFVLLPFLLDIFKQFLILFSMNSVILY